MSKLADRIRRASRQAPAPMGFAAAAASAPAPTLLCLVRLSAGEASKVGEAAGKGADAVIVDGIEAGKLKSPAQAAGGASLGVGVPKATRQSVSSLRDAGADFVVVDVASAMAEALLEEKIGFVLAMEAAPDDSALRLLNDMGLDALLTPAPSGPLTLERLLQLRRVSALSRTPMLVEVAADVEASTLQALRESGVVGVIVDSSSLGKLERLRERIASLPPRGKKREERGEATLPALAGVPAEMDEDDDDD